MSFLINPYVIGLVGLASTATLSPHFTSPNLTLSNGNLTVTRSVAFNGSPYIASMIDAKASERVYCELTVNNDPVGNIGIGIGNYKIALSGAYLGYDNNSANYTADGRVVYTNQNQPGTPGPYTTGDIISVDLNSATGQVRFRKNGGAWSNTFTIGGGGAFQLAIEMYNENSQVTINFGATAFAYAPPAGGSAWEANGVVSSDTWRFVARANNNAQSAMGEVELRIAAGGADITGSGTPSSASAFSASFTADKAFDNNTATCAHSANNQGAGWWLQYLFVSPQPIIEAHMTARTDNLNYPTSFRWIYFISGVPFIAYGRDALVWTLGETKTFNWE